MFAKIIFGVLLGSAAIISTSASAQDVNGWKFTLTEAEQPGGKAWEDPARISLTIDPNGEDIFSAQINLEIGRKIVESVALSNGTSRIGRDVDLGGYVRWNRESGGDDKQNNLEFGASVNVGRDIVGLYDVSDEELRLSNDELQKLINRRKKFIDYAFSVSTGYARTAKYADLSVAPCNASPNLLQCGTQFSESIRSTAELGFYSPKWQGFHRSDTADGGEKPSGLAYVFSPKIGLSHDYLLNSPLNVKSGIVEKGSYLSALVGAKIKLSPSFVDQRFELSAEAQLRQKMSVSNSRRGTIEKSAERVELSATYYPVIPSDAINDGIRLGLGVTYTHGHDPLVGEPEGDKVVFALRLGWY